MRRKVFFLCLLIIQLCTASHTRYVMKSGDLFPQDGSGAQSVSNSIYQQYMSSHKILTREESQEVETVNRVSNLLINAVKTYYASRKSDKQLDGFNWEIHLFNETKEDAWCLPGGKMAVYSALLPLTQSDASLAVILAHSIAHTLLKHGDVRMKQYLKEFLGAKDLSASLSKKPGETKEFYKMAYGNGDYVGVIRGFNSGDEMEADQLAAIFCSLAGFKPQESIVFWERMSHLRFTGRTPILLSTHPVDDKRVRRLRETMDDIARDYYKPISKN
jgi:predicted Zn-dependent protease